MPLIVYQLMKNLDMKVTNVMVRTRQKKKKKKKKKKKNLDSTRLGSLLCVCITYMKNVFIGCQDRLGTTKRISLIEKRKCVFAPHRVRM